MSRQILQSVCLVACLFITTGCDKASPLKFRFNGVEWVKQEKTHQTDLDDAYQTEIGTILTMLFGTPDDPKFPFYLTGEEDPSNDIITIENLRMAAGPVRSDKRGAPTGLYREHCVHCHGITGDGAGPTAALLNPYPRDFRLGKFKFKSTPLRQPPPDHDLQKIIENGIPGTAMPSFRTLPPDEIQALIEYVKYLTIRGQFERILLAELAGLDGEALIDLSLIAKSEDGEEPSDDDVEEFEDQVYTLIGDGLQDRIIARWIDPERKITKIAPAPVEFKTTHPGHTKLIDHGRELFFSKGNCLQCHGDTGVGDGQLSNFDDWTNDWKNSTNVDPDDPSTYQDFTDVGALRPRPVRPRNLNVAGYRGGDHPHDLFLRLTNGIEGTPMPASTAMTSDEIWALVAYVKSLPYTNESPQSINMPVNDNQVLR